MEVRGDAVVKDSVEFIVIGAAKAGTTSLFEYLRRHPELGLAPDKEVPFFSNEAVRARGWDDYLRRTFFQSDPALKWGTVTPQYLLGGLLEHPNPSPSGQKYDERTVPLRIRERVPNARLIALLRDPALRARSQHRMALMNHIDDRSFSQAIDELLMPDSLDAARQEPREETGYVVWGEYGRLLAPYFELFPPRQLLILFTEELEKDPEATLRRIFEFLDVRSDFVPDNLGVRYRVGASDRRLSWLGHHSPLHPWAVRNALARSSTARRLWRALPYRDRRRIDGWLARFVYGLDLWNRRSRDDRPIEAEADSETVTRLRGHYAPDIRRLASLVGRMPPWPDHLGISARSRNEGASRGS